jgi:hypothetical protein
LEAKIGHFENHEEFCEELEGAIEDWEEEQGGDDKKVI